MLQNIRRAQTGLAARREQAHQNNRKAAEAGFTLIELLIVIVILGILAAVVVFSVRGIQDKGQESACKADTSTLVSAEEAYYASPDTGGSYATMQQLLDAGLINSASTLHTITGATDTGYTIAPAGSTCSDTTTVPAPAAGGGD